MDVPMWYDTGRKDCVSSMATSSIVLGFLPIPVLRSSLRKMYGVQVLHFSVGGYNLHGKVLLQIPFAVWFACAIFGALDIYHADVWKFLGGGSLFFSAAVSFLFLCGVSWKKRDREHQRRLTLQHEISSYQTSKGG